MILLCLCNNYRYTGLWNGIELAWPSKRTSSQKSGCKLFTSYSYSLKISYSHYIVWTSTDHLINPTFFLIGSASPKGGWRIAKTIRVLPISIKYEVPLYRRALKKNASLVSSNYHLIKQDVETCFCLYTYHFAELILLKQNESHTPIPPIPW